jgi:hypothetical protein
VETADLGETYDGDAPNKDERKKSPNWSDDVRIAVGKKKQKLSPKAQFVCIFPEKNETGGRRRVRRPNTRPRGGMVKPKQKRTKPKSQHVKKKRKW